MFGSDNQAPAHPKVLDALLEANQGRMGSYGDDPWTARAKAEIARTFETDDFDVEFAATGSAANGLALSALCQPWAAILTHSQSHLVHNEGTGPEFFTSGARVIGLGKPTNKLLPSDLEAASRLYGKTSVRGLQPQVVSIANLSENGLIYTPDEIKALSAVCQLNEWHLHCDGARFGNAVKGSGATAADLTWRAGVDALSLGLTKTGGLACEAVVLFGQARGKSLMFQRKRAGQLVSKHRLFGAQFVAMLESDLWLELSQHANKMALELEKCLVCAGATIFYQVQGNEVFARLTQQQSAALNANGLGHYPEFVGDEADVYRFVTCWQTSEADIEAVKTALV
jgi:threonine aldolase